MAHGDYDCCAVCDGKQSYNEDASSKDEICSSCLHSLRDEGLNILDTKELILWIEKEDIVVLEDKLRKMMFHICFYGNNVDDAVSKRFPNLTLKLGSKF